MAYLVRVEKKIGLLDPQSRILVRNNRPYLLHNRDFVSLCVSRRQMRVIDAEVADNATDADFEHIWGQFCESKTQEKSAIASFLSIYGSPEDLEEEPSVKVSLEPKELPKSQETKIEEDQSLPSFDAVVDPQVAKVTFEEIPEGHKICERCGAIYMPRNKMQKYCNGPECKK